MKIFNKVTCVILSLVLISLSFSAFAAKNPKISKKSKTVTVGETFTLSVKNTGGSVKWSSGNKSIAKIIHTSGKVNGKAKIKAVKSGTVTITAKTNAGKVKCKVTVKAKKTVRKKKTVTRGSGGGVYITETGDKYHSDGCRCLRKSKIAISRSSAESQGYEPCGICKP